MGNSIVFFGVQAAGCVAIRGGAVQLRAVTLTGECTL